MQPYHLVFTPAVANRDGICESQTPSGAGPLTLNGDLVMGAVAVLDIPRHVILVTAVAEPGRLFTVTGTDRNGNTISEVLPERITPGLATGKINFKTVTSVSVTMATAGAVTIGTADSFDLAPYVFDHYGVRSGFSVIGASAGSYSWRRQFTFEDILAEGSADGDTVAWLNDIVREADYGEVFDGPLVAMRIAVTKYVSGIVGFHVLESMEHM